MTPQSATYCLSVLLGTLRVWVPLHVTSMPTVILFRGSQVPTLTTAYLLGRTYTSRFPVAMLAVVIQAV